MESISHVYRETNRRCEKRHRVVTHVWFCALVLTLTEYEANDVQLQCLHIGLVVLVVRYTQMPWHLNVQIPGWGAVAGGAGGDFAVRSIVYEFHSGWWGNGIQSHYPERQTCTTTSNQLPR